MKFLLLIFAAILGSATLNAQQLKLTDNFPASFKLEKVPGERLTDLCLNESNRVTLEFHRGNDKEIWMAQDYEVQVLEGEGSVKKISKRVFEVTPTSSANLMLNIMVKINDNVLYPVPKSGDILDEVTDNAGKVIESKVNWTKMSVYVEKKDPTGKLARAQTIIYRVKECD